VDPTYLSLCPEENVIYEEFRRCFPEFDVSHFTEDDLKSSEAKKVVFLMFQSYLIYIICVIESFAKFRYVCRIHIF